jgi:hypothetical protein
LASIISFITGRRCIAARDPYFNEAQLSESKIIQAATLLPVLTAGPGSSFCCYEEDQSHSPQEPINRIPEVLGKVNDKTYMTLMQAIKLPQLSIPKKREDFGLAYLLIVSAIEAITQIAISRKSVSEKHPKEADWERKAKSDAEWNELLVEYTDGALQWWQMKCET